jgi:acetyl esterase
MAKIDLRMRLVGATIGRMSIATQPDDKIVASQKRTIKHNPVIDLLLGGLAEGVTVEDGTAAGGDDSIPIRVYRPSDEADVLPLVILTHGGGWATGSLDIYDWLGSNLAVQSRAVVVSLEYRLAPTHRWPAAADDCYAAFVDVVGRAAAWNADGARVAVAGDSAGGNLAAVVTLMARDRSGPPIAFQALIYPATDLTLGSRSIEENANAPILTKRDITAFRDLYTTPENRTDPYASPLLAQDHSRLPPALIQVAEHDPIRDDGLRYADALRNAGVAVRTTTYVGMPHGFLAFPRISRAAPQALEELGAAIREALR